MFFVFFCFFTPPRSYIVFLCVPVSDFSKKNNSLKLNQQVSHERFGLGIILEIEGEGKDKIASINFNGIGIKKLLLRFAKLKST